MARVNHGLSYLFSSIGTDKPVQTVDQDQMLQNEASDLDLHNFLTWIYTIFSALSVQILIVNTVTIDVVSSL